ncbi:hypothetical protein BS78_05G143200 [Paspalum vaginatum]|nr:hypothetical protein BS78_05G143200 [Paspalum vaginatum]
MRAFKAKAANVVLVLAALICCLVSTGNAQHGHNGGCHPSDIKISLKQTGKLVEGQSEYLVTIDNQCSCPQASVYVRCLGLPSVEPVDGSRIRAVDGQLCLVAGGGQIVRGSPVTFTYAWKTPQDFTVVSAKPRC